MSQSVHLGFLCCFHCYSLYSSAISVVAESKVDSKQLDSVVSPNLFCRTLLFHWTRRSVYCLRCYWWGVHYTCHFGVCFLYALYQLCSQSCVSFPGDLLLALWDRPHCIGQGSLKLMVLLPQSPEHWNYRHESASLVCMKTSSMVTFNFFFLFFIVPHVLVVTVWVQITF